MTESKHVPVDQLDGKTIKKASEGPHFGAIRLEFTDGTKVDIGAYTTGDDVWICEVK